MHQRVLLATQENDRGLTTIIHAELHWLDVSDRVTQNIGLFVHRCLRGKAPKYIINCCTPVYCSVCRSPQLVVSQLRCRHRLITLGGRAFTVTSPIVWNSLPYDLRSQQNNDCFCRFLFFRLITSIHSALEMSVKMRYINLYATLHYSVHHTLARQSDSVVRITAKTYRKAKNQTSRHAKIFKRSTPKFARMIMSRISPSAKFWKDLTMVFLPIFHMVKYHFSGSDIISFFWFFCRQQPRPHADLNEKYVKRRSSAQECAFSGFENKI